MMDLIAGVDEVGRGPLAGPVVAAAVILDPERPIVGLKDSKKLSAKQRERLSETIKSQALCYALGRAEVAEIDEINILRASLLAMQRAIEQLSVQPTCVLVDGRECPCCHCAVEAIIRGDETISEISAASIIAKVARDFEMSELESIYPGYGFAQHKGYPTKQHVEAIRRLGVLPIQRQSFGPVKEIIMSSDAD